MPSKKRKARAREKLRVVLGDRYKEFLQRIKGHQRRLKIAITRMEKKLEKETRK